MTELEQTRGQVQDTRASRAAARSEAAGKGKGGAIVETLLDVGIDGRPPIDSARQVADAALAGADGNRERAVDAVVGQHYRIAAAGGFVTGLGGVFTLPVALPANVAEFYLTATRMVASIAAVRGYDIDKPEVRSAVLLTLIGADSDDLLKKAGYSGSGQVFRLATERLPAPVLLIINKAIAFKLFTQLAKKTLAFAGKGLPFVGGAVGAGVDTYMMKRIADQARQEFTPVP